MELEDLSEEISASERGVFLLDFDASDGTRCFRCDGVQVLEVVERTSWTAVEKGCQGKAIQSYSYENGDLALGLGSRSC